MEFIEMILGVIIFLIWAVIMYNLMNRKNDDSVVRQKYESIQSVSAKEQPQSVNVSVSVKNPSSDILVNSPYYNKYRKTFDIIRNSGKEPKYRIDWLLKSLDMGHELEHEGVFVTASISKNFPYFCETEEEFERLSKDDCLALKGSVAAIFGLGYLYSGSHMKSFLQEKRDYWRNQILNMANTGNLEARAGLCQKNFLFTEQEVEEFKEKYEAELLYMAEAGNPYAQLAVGQFLAKNRKEKLEWLNKAGGQGLSDAYHYLAVAYTQMRFLDDDFNYKPILLDEKEEQLIDKKIGECYLKGAELNKGMMAAECQHNLGNAYHYGYYGFEKNLANARYWYEKAFQNGKESAGTCMENIEKFGA